jgi:hypothetical protein
MIGFMTHEEQRQQKAMLLLECTEAESELAALKEKAKRTSEAIKAFGEWLGGASHGQWRDGDSYLAGLGKVNVLTDPRFEAAMSFAKAKELVDQISEVQKRVDDLRNRKRELGL